MDMGFPDRPEALQGGYHTREAFRIWTCAFLLPWGIQAQVVRFSRLGLCNFILRTFVRNRCSDLQNRHIGASYGSCAKIVRSGGEGGCSGGTYLRK